MIGSFVNVVAIRAPKGTSAVFACCDNYRYLHPSLGRKADIAGGAQDLCKERAEANYFSLGTWGCIIFANKYVNMADLNFRPDELQSPAGRPSEVSDRESELFEFIELMFFAYRDFTSDPNAILDEFGFGRAHHRALHFVNRNPGLRVADLLDILRITKQSLGRVLKQLVDEGFIERRTGPSDRRERLLYPTRAGRELADRLARPQFARFAAAIAASKAGEPDAAKRFLMNLVNATERPRVAAILRGGESDAGAGEEHGK